MEGTYELFDADPDDPALRVHAADVFTAAPWPMEVIGPMPEDEARAVFQM